MLWKLRVVTLVLLGVLGLATWLSMACLLDSSHPNGFLDLAGRALKLLPFALVVCSGAVWIARGLWLNRAPARRFALGAWVIAGLLSALLGGAFLASFIRLPGQHREINDVIYVTLLFATLTLSALLCQCALFVFRRRARASNSGFHATVPKGHRA